MGKAKLTPTITDLLKNAKDAEKKAAGRVRADYAGVSTISSNMGSGAGTAGNQSILSSPFSNTGGRLKGEISFFPKTIDVVGGVIDLTDQTDLTGNITANTSNVNLIGTDDAGGNQPDDLDTIDGVNDTGQILFLKAVTNAITIRDGVGNILTPGGVDYVMAGDEGAILIFGSTGSTWIVLGSVGGGGTATTELDNLGVTAVNADINMLGNSVTLDVDKDTEINSFSDDNIQFITGGVLGMTLASGGVTIVNSLNVFGTVTLGDAATDLIFMTGKLASSIIPDTTSIDLGDSTDQIRNIYLQSGFTTSRLFFDGGGDTFMTGSGISGRINMFNDNSLVTVFTTDGIITDSLATGAISMTGDIALQNNSIVSVDDIDFNTTGQSINGTTGGLHYLVPSGDQHNFFVAGTNVVSILDQGINMFSRELDFDSGGRLDLSDNQLTIGSNGSASALTANPVGYANIKINGVERIIPYYRA